jgi:hypothetical protein
VGSRSGALEFRWKGECLMDILTKIDLKNLMEKKDFSWVSIYMPTFRTSPEAKQNPIRFKNLLKRMEERLVTAGLRKSEAKALSSYGKALVKDRLFWQYQSDGFVAFLSSKWFRSFDHTAIADARAWVANK